MVKAWTALYGQTLINLLCRRFKMSILRQLHQVFAMAVKMSYVVAMCRRGVLNSKSKRFSAIWPLTYMWYVIQDANLAKRPRFK